MNFPVLATVERSDMPRTRGEGVLRISIALHRRECLVECIVLKHEEHGSAVPAAISRALGFLLPDPV